MENKEACYLEYLLGGKQLLNEAADSNNQNALVHFSTDILNKIHRLAKEWIKADIGDMTISSKNIKNVIEYLVAYKELVDLLNGDIDILMDILKEMKKETKKE